MSTPVSCCRKYLVCGINVGRTTTVIIVMLLQFCVYLSSCRWLCLDMTRSRCRSTRPDSMVSWKSIACIPQHERFIQIDNWFGIFFFHYTVKKMRRVPIIRRQVYFLVKIFCYLFWYSNTLAEQGWTYGLYFVQINWIHSLFVENTTRHFRFKAFSVKNILIRRRGLQLKTNRPFN